MKRVETDELRAALQNALRAQLGRPLQVTHMTREVSKYLTSFPIEELSVELDDGATLQLIFKNLDWNMLRDEVRQIKPRFLYNAMREVETYRSILPAAPPGPPFYYGSLLDVVNERYWLFLEKVRGLELYQIGELDKWHAAAAWLAKLHSTFAGKDAPLRDTAPLLVYDEAFYSRWLHRARGFAAESNDTPPEAKRDLEWLAGRYQRVIARLLELPTTFIHGEFYASNVLIATDNSDYRVAPVDWEVAAIGPAVFDLAALTAGTWTAEQQQEMARAYFDALPDRSLWPPTFAELLDALDLAHIAIAVQWLGWAQTWSPPIETGQNWLGIALQLARKLGGATI